MAHSRPWAPRLKMNSEMQIPAGHLDSRDLLKKPAGPCFSFPRLQGLWRWLLGWWRNDVVLVLGSIFVPTNALNIFQFLNAFVKEL